ncbi:MAG: sigma-54 dependent transcriptional regulator, partial [bacterium]
PMIGSSPAMQKLRLQTFRWARASANILILGERGTGKEAVARALHYQSPRAFEPFVSVNCPAIPEQLLESELFGCVKGAFTSADRDREGRLERAQGGTLYLAEIGDLPERLQAKLLHVLSESEACRVGSNQSYKLNVRFIAATNRDPKVVLRADFLERIAGGILEVPPLRDRREDVPEILAYWLDRLCAEDKTCRTISAEALAVLKCADWPGNVRQLIHFLRNLLVLGEEGTEITADEVRRNLGGTSVKSGDFFEVGLTYTEALLRFERELLTQRLTASKGNRSDVAKSLGLSRATLYEKLQRCGL